MSGKYVNNLVFKGASFIDFLRVKIMPGNDVPQQNPITNSVGRPS
jgi:hypothetical protein